MEVFRGHARAQAITRDTVFLQIRLIWPAVDMSRDVAGVVSDVSFLCPRVVATGGN
jgi:hypothetical protein